MPAARPATAPAPATAADPRPAQVFLEAIAAPRPPLRCITARLPAPLARLRPGGPDGADYVRAMHDFVFGPGEAAEEQP